jgi:hypothetical protein
MKRKVGLWIDHKKAIIVFLAGDQEEIKIIKSNVQKQIRRDAASRPSGPFESQAVPSDDRQQQKFTGHLDTYYHQVIKSIDNAESVMIFGPGEAKGELRKHLEQARLGQLIVALETVDKMTVSQIAAKVRQYFLAKV